MSRNGQKRALEHVRQANIQISLRICAVWSESSLGAFCIAKDPQFLHADSGDYDQIARMRKLIWFFAGRHVRRYVVGRCGSYIDRRLSGRRSVKINM